MNLVVGATGYLGGEICRLLAEQGKPVRALVRSTSDPERVASLRDLGAEVVEGDLKDRSSLDRACAGATAVLSTATVIVRAQEGDSFERTDRQGQLDLVEAAEQAGVRRFVFVSFPEIPIEFPLQDAKRAVEERLRASGLTYTILRPGVYPESWLSPRLGWDVAAGRGRIYANGDGQQNWVAVRDVAEVAVGALDDPRAANAVIELGGEYLSWNEILGELEAATGREFETESIPLEALQAQYDAAADPHTKTFGGLALAMAYGDPVDRTAELRQWLRRPTPVREAVQA